MLYLYILFVGTAKYNKCTLSINVTDILVMSQEKETTMKRFIIILLFSIILLLTLIICTNNTDNTDLESERNQLKSEIKTLQSEIENLQRIRDELIQKDDIVYIIELQISQSHFSLDFDDLLKDEFNKITIPIQVSKEYYYSVEIGDTLSNEFRVGSFIFKGSIGNWDIKVINKQTVDVTN